MMFFFTWVYHQIFYWLRLQNKFSSSVFYCIFSRSAVCFNSIWMSIFHRIKANFSIYTLWFSKNVFFLNCSHVKKLSSHTTIKLIRQQWLSVYNWKLQKSTTKRRQGLWTGFKDLKSQYFYFRSNEIFNSSMFF